MRFKLFLSGCACAALALYALPLGAITVQECVPGKVSAASYTWNFQGEADNTFQDMQAQARQLRDEAANLQSLVRDPNVSWEAHADQLARMKTDVNKMGEELCRLESIRRVLAPWQQKTVDQLRAEEQLMADNTEDAIMFLSSNQEHLWSPTYHKYVDNLYDQADQTVNSAGNAASYAEVLHQYKDLRQDLGVSAS